MPKPPINTTYNGMQVDEATALDLQNQPSAEYMSFEKNDDGTYTIQAKFPEWGRIDGVDFHIRENFNFLLRGIARCCLDENGFLDAEKASKLNNELGPKISEGTITDELYEKCEIPDEQKEDFNYFLSFCRSEIAILTYQFFGEIEQLQSFQYAINEAKSKPYDKELNISDEYSIVSESYNDYRNMLNSFKVMASMDPKKEKRILYAAGNRNFGGVFQPFFVLNNNYRYNHNLQMNTGDRHDISFSKIKDDIANNLYVKHESLHYFLMDTKVGDKPMAFIVETHAGETGKLYFCPEKVRTGVGLFNSRKDYEKFNTDQPYVYFPSEKIETYTKLGNVPEDFKTIKKIRPNHDFYFPEMTRDFDVKYQMPLKQAYRELKNASEENKFEAINKVITNQNQADEFLKTMVDKSVEASAAELNRLAVKEMLIFYADTYKMTAQGDNRLEDILEKIRTYATMDVTALRGNYDAESALFDEIYAKTRDYFNELDEKQILIPDPENGKDSYDPEDPVNRSRYLMLADLYNFFESHGDGELLLNPNKPEAGAAYVDGREFPIRMNPEDNFIDVSDRQLFPHEPNPEDIKKGFLEDDYLLDGLRTLAMEDPQKIKECMRDNKDGTVTVRFYTQKMNEETGMSEGFMPVYVTVDKKIPVESGAENCLWAQMIERAYVASGLYIGSDKYSKPVPSKEELEQKYQEFSKLSPKERPSHTQYPWLIDSRGILNHWDEWYTDYGDIQNGNSTYFLSHILGKDVAVERNPLEREDANVAAANLFVGDTVSKYEKALNDFRKGLHRSGNDSDEFKALCNAISEFYDKDPLPKLYGESINKVSLEQGLSNINGLCESYLEHCKQNQHILSPRRDNRVYQAKKLMTIYDALKNGYKEPKDGLGKVFVDKMMEGNAQYNAMNDNQKDMNINKFINGKEFTYWKETMSFDEMIKLSEKPTDKIMRAFKNACDHVYKNADKEAQEYRPQQVEVQAQNAEGLLLP